jgi:hypothetical protein
MLSFYVDPSTTAWLFNIIFHMHKLLDSTEVFCFRYKTPYSPLEVNWRFGGARRFQNCACCLLHAWHILRPWRLRRYVPSKRLLTFSGLHCIMSQEIEFFITTAVRASNPAVLFACSFIEFYRKLCILSCVTLIYSIPVNNNFLFFNADVLLKYYHATCFGLSTIIRRFQDNKLCRYSLLNCLRNGSVVASLVESTSKTNKYIYIQVLYVLYIYI